ncbi:MAG: hypothetical protein HQ515_22720 [Phycisphaeraceae bacterium]|nr:hypothetical protein [Phycisphaeraceae bacterium]
MKTLTRVSVVLVALAVLTGVALAEEVRVNWDYAATGIDEGSGLWSVTIDSGLIPNPDLDPNDPNSSPYLDPNTPVTFVAGLATPVFTQRDALLDGDVIPDIPGIVGWTNDATNAGRTQGVSWVFYEAGEVVTLRSTTRNYLEYTFEVQTTMVCPDKTQDDICSGYHWAFSFADNPDGLDVIDSKLQTVSWQGDVEGVLWDEDTETETYGLGHRHSGSTFDKDTALGEGQDICRDARNGSVDEDADGDGIGVSLGIRKTEGDDQPGTASIFLYNVVIGGNVFADTDSIYAEDINQD